MGEYLDFGEFNDDEPEAVPKEQWDMEHPDAREVEPGEWIGWWDLDD